MSSHFPEPSVDQIPPSDELLAGEYVLGVLDADQRWQVQSRILAEPRFALLVDAWEARLEPWLMRFDAVEPSPHVWPRIRTGLGWSSVQGARGGVWNSVGFWRAATGLAMAAGVLAFVIGLRQSETVAPLQPVTGQVATSGEQAAKPVVVLARDNGTPGWLASIDAVHNKILMVPVPSALDVSGLVDELWIIPPGQAPYSLGFVSNEKSHTVEVPAAIRRALAVGATLAITLEPQAGMPHAAPSGPIVAKGNIAAI